MGWVILIELVSKIKILLLDFYKYYVYFSNKLFFLLLLLGLIFVIYLLFILLLIISTAFLTFFERNPGTSTYYLVKDHYYAISAGPNPEVYPDLFPNHPTFHLWRDPVASTDLAATDRSVQFKPSHSVFARDARDRRRRVSRLLRRTSTPAAI